MSNLSSSINLRRSGCWSTNKFEFDSSVGSFSSCSSLEQLWSVSGGGPWGKGGGFSMQTVSFNSILSESRLATLGLVQLAVVIVVVDVGEPMVVVHTCCCSNCSSIRTLLMWQFGMGSLEPFCNEVSCEEVLLIPEVEEPNESLDSVVDWLKRRLCCSVGLVVWSF